jgi:hypothetical protein
MRLVLNPDGAPLSEAEAVQLEALLATYLRKQGFALPGQVVKRPVAKDLLHAWPTLFFLRDAAPALRETREREEVAAAEEAARRAAEVGRMQAATGAPKGSQGDRGFAAVEVDVGGNVERSLLQTPPAGELVAGVDPLAALLQVTGESEPQGAPGGGR